MTSIYKKRETDTEEIQGRRLCETEAEIKVMLPQAKGNTKDCWQPPKAMKKQRRILPYSLWREHGPANNLILDF